MNYFIRCAWMCVRPSGKKYPSIRTKPWWRYCWLRQKLLSDTLFNIEVKVTVILSERYKCITFQNLSLSILTEWTGISVLVICLGCSTACRSPIICLRSRECRNDLMKWVGIQNRLSESTFGLLMIQVMITWQWICEKIDFRNRFPLVIPMQSTEGCDIF